MEEQPMNTEPTASKQRVKLDFSLWWLVGLLAVVIVLLVALWRPWQASGDDSRTVTVTGTTTIKATPDEYTFNPTWQFKDDNKTASLQAATAKSDTVIAELKKLGVPDGKITHNLGGWDRYYFFDSASGVHTYSLTIGVVVSTRALAQKVQDYLATTEPTGQVTPNLSFSQATQKKLESQARTAATKEARAKAEEMAKNLGFTVGKVKSIDDQDGGGGVMPFADSLSQGVATDAEKRLTVQPGEQEIAYSVEVTYYIR